MNSNKELLSKPSRAYVRGLIFRGVGIVRAKSNIAMTNLVYNMCRLAQIIKYHPEWIVA